MDPKTINWKLVTAVLLALGYVAYRNKGFKGITKAITKHGTIAAVLGIVAYFGWDYVMNRVQKELPEAELPPEGTVQPGLDGYGSIEQNGIPAHMRSQVTGPGGHAVMPSLGC